MEPPFPETIPFRMPATSRLSIQIMAKTRVDGWHWAETIGPLELPSWIKHCRANLSKASFCGWVGGTVLIVSAKELSQTSDSVQIFCSGRGGTIHEFQIWVLVNSFKMIYSRLQANTTLSLIVESCF